MILNNIEIDTKTKCIEQQLTQTELAKRIEVTTQYLNRLVKGKDASIVNEIYLSMMEELGYDVKLTYVPRDEQ